MTIHFGSSAKTSDFSVDNLLDCVNRLPEEERRQIKWFRFKVDNGPETSGQCFQSLSRMVDFTDYVGKPVHLLYCPPYHSKYNPIERC